MRACVTQQNSGLESGHYLVRTTEIAKGSVMVSVKGIGLVKEMGREKERA